MQLRTPYPGSPMPQDADASGSGPVIQQVPKSMFELAAEEDQAQADEQERLAEEEVRRYKSLVHGRPVPGTVPRALGPRTPPPTVKLGSPVAGPPSGAGAAGRDAEDEEEVWKRQIGWQLVQAVKKRQPGMPPHRPPPHGVPPASSPPGAPEVRERDDSEGPGCGGHPLRTGLGPFWPICTEASNAEGQSG